MGLISRLRDTSGQLWRPGGRAEQCPTHRYLAQITSTTRVRQPLAMEANGRTSDTRRVSRLELAPKSDSLDGGLDDCIERADLGGKDGR